MRGVGVGGLELRRKDTKIKTSWEIVDTAPRCGDPGKWGWRRDANFKVDVDSGREQGCEKTQKVDFRYDTISSWEGWHSSSRRMSL
jgi:hypothetical protein